MRSVWFALGLELWSSICYAHCKVWHSWDRFPEKPFFGQALFQFSEMYRSDPMGGPSTGIPLGCHTAGPTSSTFCGEVPALFHTRVFPSCNWIPRDPVQSCRQQVIQNLHASKNAHNCSPWRSAGATSNGKQERIRRSPCSPPSACVTSRASPPSPNHS